MKLGNRVSLSQQIINHDAYLAGIISGSALLGIDAIVFMMTLCGRPAQTIELPQSQQPRPSIPTTLKQTTIFKSKGKPDLAPVTPNSDSSTASTPSLSGAATVTVNTGGITDTGRSFIASDEL